MKITDKTKEFIRNNYRSMRVQDIADHLGLSPATVVYHRQTMKLKRKIATKLTEQDAEKIRELKAKGVHYKQIAAMFNVSQFVVYNALNGKYSKKVNGEYFDYSERENWLI